MGLTDLPYTFEVWLQMRNKHLEQNLMYSKYTKDLFSQYRKLFGMFRFLLMLVAQALILPQILRMLMGFRKMPL